MAKRERPEIGTLARSVRSIRRQIEGVEDQIAALKKKRVASRERDDDDDDDDDNDED